MFIEVLIRYFRFIDIKNPSNIAWESSTFLRTRLSAVDSRVRNANKSLVYKYCHQPTASSGWQLRTPPSMAVGVGSPLSRRRILNLRILNLVVVAVVLWLFVTFTFGNLFSLFTGDVRAVFGVVCLSCIVCRCSWCLCYCFSYRLFALTISSSELRRVLTHKNRQANTWDISCARKSQQENQFVSFLRSLLEVV